MGEATYTRDGNVIYDGDLYVPDARLARAGELLERAYAEGINNELAAEIQDFIWGDKGRDDG